ncbi:MAG: GNAT family N-acetyltransferase [Alphaproteobacteria bacterium]|nr:GNAT family N-acetyltransferase [Alphaproteobacteria bacterium]
MSASKLVKPNAAYKQSYLEALDEFHAEGRYKSLSRSEIEKNFDKYVEELNTGKRYLRRPFVDWVEPVPETVLWLVKKDEYIGSITIRHRLNWHLEKWGGHVNFTIRPSMRKKGFGKKILQKGMPYICYLGIDRALVLVDPLNIAGQRVVEFCGGEFQDETQKTDRFPARKRYWLQCG